MARKKLILIVSIFLVSVMGISTGSLMFVYSKTKDFDDIFMQGIYVDGIYIGGLTKEEARKQISNEMKKQDESRHITFYSEDKKWEIPHAKFQGTYNIDEVLDKAFIIGHTGNMVTRYREFTAKETKKVDYALTRSHDEQIAKSILEEYAQELYIAPQDAKMTRENRKFIITPETPGQELNIDETANKLNNAYKNLEEGKVEVEAVIAPVEAKITAPYYDNVQTPIASFYTTYTNKDPSRNINLKVGADSINAAMKPGETFALSEYLGVISAENGYKNATVIVNGEFVDGIGGGICQVASTLYNSVLLTDLEVVSRQNHSLPVGYIPLGRDATYASNSIDFKFKNPTEYPVYIESYAENNRLYVNIFGHESLKPEHEYRFESETTEIVPAPASKYIKDDTLPKGKEVQKVAPLTGKKVNLYKYIYKDGKLIDKVLENKSYYRPRAAVIRVGTQEVPQAPVEKKEPEVEVIDDPSMMDLYEE